MSPVKNPKEAQSNASEKDWFQLLLEIDRRFRSEERKTQRRRTQKNARRSADNSRSANSSGGDVTI